MAHQAVALKSSQPATRSAWFRKRGIIGVLGLAAIGTKLLLPPFVHTLPTTLLSTISDSFLTLLLTVAAWKASRRSANVAQVFWICIAAVSTLWTINSGTGAFMIATHGVGAALATFWRSTIIFYLAAITLALPLLLHEGHERPGIDWLRTFDIAQLAIVTFCAYLLFVYVPMLSSSSEAFRVRQFMVLHWLRDGFLAVGFLYRGLRSLNEGLRRLQFGAGAFFLAFSVAGSIEIYFFEKLKPWQIPLLDFVAALPVLFLLLLAVGWQQDHAAALQVRGPRTARELFWAQLLPVLLPGSVIAMATRIPSQSLRLAWVAVAASVACYAGRLIVMQHRQEIAQSTLRTLEDRFSKAFKVSPAAITISHLSDGRYIDVNDRWLEMSKLGREEVIGRTSTELGIWLNPDDRKQLVEAIQKTGSVRDLAFNFCLGGRTIAVLVSAELIEFDGAPLIITSTLDVSELANALQQLRQAQKMELVGTLAGGIAHDFNNLLTVIKGYAELVESRELQGEADYEVKRIVEAANKAASLTKQLLSFSRRQVLQPRNIVLSTVVTGIEPMLRPMLRENIELVYSSEPDLGIVFADPAQMEQVLMNLASNARDAMPGGGQLRIDIRNLDLPAPYAERYIQIPAGRYVMLAVADTGSGISSENLNRIFEPFFTTKEAGRGTGLGLSTVYGIVKQSGGYIWAYSEVGMGTTFKICLPRVDRAADAVTAQLTPAHAASGGETVLLVEDDASLRELTEKILERYGYRVITASSGAQGFQRGHEYDGEIHLLLSDLVMTKGSGLELADRLRAQRPSLRVLFMSGYPYSLVAGSETVDLLDSFLPKPFSPSELAAKIRETLDRPRAM